MSVNLVKGQKVNLTKENSGLKNIMIGCGWDEASKSDGLLSKLFNVKQDIDVDASVIICRNGHFVDKSDLVYFSHLKHSSGAVIHTGDNLTGAGEGDDEVILIHLDKMPSDCDKIIFVANIFKAINRKQNFGMVSNAFIRLVDMDKNNKELYKYNISGGVSPESIALIFGELYKKDNEWKFNAIGEGTTDASISEICKRYF